MKHGLMREKFMKRLLVAIHWATFFWAATFYMWMGFYQIGDSAIQVFTTGLAPHFIAIAVWRLMEGKVVLFPWRLGVNPEEFMLGETKID